ncbi:MAG: glycosyltransferase family 9 protein [Bacteroidetes bacterium]|nr:glycosyltransferase family 9 protein [Bacteroidota bacterium]
MLDKPKRIIVARTDRIGDVVLSLPVFATLKRCYPDSELTALVSGYASDVVSSSRAVDRVMTIEPGESIYSIRQKLKRVNADVILILFPRFKVSFASFQAGIPMRVGTAYRWYSFLHNSKVHEHRKDSVKSEAEYNLTLARTLGCGEVVLDTHLEVDTEALRNVRQFMDSNEIGRFVVIHPGSGGSAYEWGPDNFRSLTRAVADDLGLKVLITGTSSEHELCARTSEGISQSLNTAGRFSLREFIALLSQAELFASNSTGPLHLAASVGTPIVGIYPNNPPMTPVRWAPLTGRKIILTPKDGSDNLSSIDVKDVMQSITSLISVKA